MSLEDTIKKETSPLMVGSCNCSEHSTFIYVGKQELTEEIRIKLGVDALELYNCVNCRTTTTDRTIKKNGGYYKWE